MTIQQAIAKLLERQDLTKDEMVQVMNCIMSGNATDAQIGGFLVALRMKGETVPEIVGAAEVMRSKAERIKSTQPNLVDTCGTGGDSSGSYNISTTAALIAAGAGAVVAKHGNRSISSKTGSADVLKQLGVNIEAGVDAITKKLKQDGIAFLFAPMLHSAMKHAIGVRKELAARTIFNLLGPLTNPAGANRQVIGVYAEHLTELLAEVLRDLGSTHLFVVHGYDGMDEVTLTARTKISELKDGKITNWVLDPKDYGFEYCSAEDISGGEPEQNAKIILNILTGRDFGARRSIALLNSALAIVAAGRAESIKQGLELARLSLDSGAAMAKLEKLRN